MRKILALTSLLCVLAHAEAPDRPVLPDGGSLFSSSDGGGPVVTADTYQVNDWVMTIKCRSYVGSPNVHYRLSTDGTAATAADNVIPVDQTWDVPVSQGSNEKYRYLSLRGEDGGAPVCNVFKNPK